MRTFKRIAAVISLLAFSLVAFVVPASAEDNTFPGQPLPQIGKLTSQNYTYGFASFGGGSITVYESSDSLHDVVEFAVDEGTSWLPYYATNTAEGEAWYYSTTGQNAKISLGDFDNVSGMYYRNGTSRVKNTFPTANVPVFSSLQAGLTAASLFLGFGNVPDTQTYRFTVPAGYVAYISLEDPDQDIEISATMFQNSALIGSNGSYWPSNATIRDGASYPTAGTQFPISGADTIRWFKDAGGSTNLLGQTKAARSTFSATTNLIEIYNPYHTGSTVGDSTEAATSWLAGDPNPNLVVTVTGLSPDGVRMYALSDRLDVSSDAASFIVSGSNDDYDDYVESSNQPPAPEDADPDNPQPVISWKNKDGDPTPAPTPGGENEPIQSASIADILNNFLNRFTSLFTEGFEAIRNLSENASQFVSRLSSLYAWLPPQILGVLTSAIILAIIIGVLKVFL